MRDEQPLDEVVFLHRGGHGRGAAALRAVIGERLRFHIAAVRERDHHVLRRDQVLDGDVLSDGDNLALPLVGEIFLQLAELVLDDFDDARRLRQDVEQIGDGDDDFPVLLANLVLLHSRLSDAAAGR